MTALEFLYLITDRRIAIKPVVTHEDLDESSRVLCWTAGFVETIPGQRRGAIPMGQYAYGATPTEAVERLIAGKTQYVWVKTGYVDGPDRLEDH